MRSILQLLRRARAAAFGLALALPAAAQDNPVVIELFTSQGCSSCPPADALLAEIGERDNVIALALHVDYWDYIGWADHFAEPAFTARQKGYARAAGWKTIYTPQVVVGGTRHAVGSRRAEVEALIAAQAAAPHPVQLTATREAGMLRIEARGAPGASVGPADIHVVRYSPSIEVDILRGENAGRTLTYSHVVQEWDVAARWNGQGTFTATLPLSGAEPVVVLVQAPDHGPVLAAARLR